MASIGVEKKRAGNGARSPGPGPSSAAKKGCGVELTVALRGVRDSDVESLPDPYCVLSVFEAGSYVQHQKTESVRNNASPQFAKKFTLNYRFEQRQKLRFDIWDLDKPDPHKGTKRSFLGRMFCTLAEIITAKGSVLSKRIWDENRPRENLGAITVSAVELDSPKEVVIMEWVGRELDKKDLLGKSDPFLTIHRLRSAEDKEGVLLYRTETVTQNLNPAWRPFRIAKNHLRPQKKSWPLKLTCIDFDDDGKHDLIGECITSYDELDAGRRKFELVHPKKGKRSGEVELRKWSVHPVYTFLDYIRGGTQIHFTVAIDFTVSNKDPASPFSLHHVHPEHPNQYMVALKAVGEIVEEYDNDRRFPALGFGARLPDGTISHDFFLNSHSADPHCQGVEGIIEAYKNAIRTVKLATPTYFTPVISFVSKLAEAQTDGSHYHVLLIITDGEVTDFQDTKSAICAASSLPMSIIIIGVGSECRDFSMNLLDSDRKLLKDNKGHTAKRDIVQFVAFRKYAKEVKQDMVKTRLAMDVLQELPTQVVGWMKMAGVKPRPPLPSYDEATSHMALLTDEIALAGLRDSTGHESGPPSGRGRRSRGASPEPPGRSPSPFGRQTSPPPSYQSYHEQT